MRASLSLFFLVFLFLFLFGFVKAQSLSIPGMEEHQITDIKEVKGPKILAIVAHPDDEIAFAGTFYKNTTFLNGACDLLTITNGEGGFKYSTLAESIYQLELTKEEIGRKHLPEIRRKELIAGCKILKVRRLFMLLQKDHRYTLDAQEILGPDAKVWDIPFVEKTLYTLLKKEKYDFVFTHLPVLQTHGHHKSATILALRAVSQLKPSERPVILGARTLRKGDAIPALFLKLPQFPITQIRDAKKSFRFDLNQSFGYKQRLNYKIIVNWAIAEHKSQGTMQLFMNRGDFETYWVYDINATDAFQKTEHFFEKLKAPQFKSKSYGPSAEQKVKQEDSQVSGNSKKD